MSGTAKVARLRAFLEAGKWDQLKMRDAILEARLPSACKLTLSAIVSHHSDANDTPRVGLRRLASLASLKPDTVNAALSKLQTMGLVQFDRQPRVLNSFDLSGTMNGLLAVPPFGTKGAAPNQGTAVPNGNTESVHSFGTDGLAHLSRSGDPICPDRGSELSQAGTQKEPGRNQAKEPSQSARESSEPAQGTESSTLVPSRRHVRNFEASFGEADPADMAAFERWAKRFGKSGALFDAKRAQCLEDRRLEGATPEDIDDALEGAAVDPWAEGTGFKLSVIFSDRERFETFRDRGREIRSGTYKPPVKRGATEPVQPRSGWKPKAEAFA